MTKDSRQDTTGTCKKTGADSRARIGKSGNRGEGKGYTPSDRLPPAECRRAGTAVPSDWKVVFGYANAIPAVSASSAEHADTEGRSHGRLMEVKPTTLGPRCHMHRGPS
ncbi:hypothetical protein GCM10010470_23900 [Saccharopolyspora taberi]|uniref:Uncharacterized protein n=1 Tax=Saccharopolyspora taberi TaxID=60895 RepID=A0ABN3VC10_9PSEU